MRMILQALRRCMTCHAINHGSKNQGGNMASLASEMEVVRALDVEAVQRALLRLDLAVFSPLQGAVADYVRYYGIDLENVVPGVRHYCGWFEAYGYRIVAHAYMPEKPQGSVFFLHGYLDHSGL